MHCLTTLRLAFSFWVACRILGGFAHSAPLPLDQVDRLALPPLDNFELKAQAALTGPIEGPVKFAEPRPVEVIPLKRGSWEWLKDGTRLWRIVVESPGAVSINLGFDRYRMPEGGYLLLYSPDYEHLRGPFTEHDNESHGQLWTPLIPGEQVVVEVGLAPGTESLLELSLASVNHGFLDLGKGGSDSSGSCNVDVACPEGDDWADQIAAVGMYTINGFRACSGSLINNTARDQKPYFLTAFHCGVSNSNAAGVVVYWNYQNSFCRPVGSPQNGQIGDGELNQFNSGAILRSQYAPSDFTLLELDDPLNPEHELFLAGWDRRSTAPSSVVGIHHPSTDEKRISFENDPTAVTSYLGNAIPGDSTHIRVLDWDLGTTEPGSSGSPIFSLQRRIVGQLHGGFAACGNDDADWYGRVFTSWTGGGSNSSSLSPWLDPVGTGESVLDGQSDNPGVNISLESSRVVACLPTQPNLELHLESVLGYTDPVQLSVTGLPQGAVSVFSINPATPPSAVVLTIEGLTEQTPPGSYPLIISASGVGVMDSVGAELVLSSGIPSAPVLVSPQAGAQGVTQSPLFTWQAPPQAEIYEFHLADNQAFSPILFSATTSLLSIQPNIELVPDSLYHWRVAARNICGKGSPSSISTFTTAAEICFTPNLPIPDNQVQGVSDARTVDQSGVIDSLFLGLRINHTYVGDLIIRLTHQPSGKSAILIDRPGTVGAQNGCSGDNIDATLRDDALQFAENTCRTSSPPAVHGELRPNNPLSLFVGEDIQGAWTLNISDVAGFDTGALAEWCLVPQFSGNPLPTSTPTPTQSEPTSTPTVSATPSPTSTETMSPTPTPTATEDPIDLCPPGGDGRIEECDLIEWLKGNSEAPLDVFQFSNRWRSAP